MRKKRVKSKNENFVCCPPRTPKVWVGFMHAFEKQR